MRLAAALAVLAGAAPPAAAAPARPGPDVLYAPAVDAPQLQSAGVWRAPPILVSGASAYRSGEFLHQDFLYDDLGAGNALAYPPDPRYGANAADLVELRVRPLPGETAVRITYNTMIAPELAATTIALGSSATPATMPHGAGARMPAQVFVTAHGGGATAVDAASGALLAALPVAVDAVRRQVEVRVPHSVFDPGERTVRVGAAAGIWDPASASYPAGLLNVAFRAEPPSFWRTEAQAGALSSGDLSAFAAHVDFAKLAAGVSDESGVPQHGFVNRIFASATEPQQGRSGDSGRRAGCPAPCVVQYAGRLQPYMLYVPPGAPPADGWPLTIDLHGCGQNHNIGLGTLRVRQLAQRGGGSVVLSPLARGDCYWYLGQAGADVFEAWADVARRLPLDPRATAIVGTSMGGYGALRLAAAYPDLFARAVGIAPCAGAGIEIATPRGVPGGEGRALLPLLPALRNVPVMTWQSGADTTCHYARALQLLRRLDELGYRSGSLTVDGLDHRALAFVALGDVEPVVSFLGAHRAPRDPPQVTFVASPTLSEPRFGMAADHAYWLSGVVPLHASEPGRIDVLSRGIGLRDPGPGEQAFARGALASGLAYAVVARLGGELRRRTPSRHLRIVSRGVREATVDATRARTSCDPEIDIRSYELLTLDLAGCNRTYHLKRVCHGTPVFDLFPRSSGRRGGVVTVRLGRRQLPVRGRLVRIDTGGDPKLVARLQVDVREDSGRRRTRLTLHHFCL